VHPVEDGSLDGGGKGGLDGGGEGVFVVLELEVVRAEEIREGGKEQREGRGSEQITKRDWEWEGRRAK
jgi:hypothetical protein